MTMTNMMWDELLLCYTLLSWFYISERCDTSLDIYYFYDFQVIYYIDNTS